MDNWNWGIIVDVGELLKAVFAILKNLVFKPIWFLLKWLIIKPLWFIFTLPFRPFMDVDNKFEAKFRKRMKKNQRKADKQLIKSAGLDKNRKLDTKKLTDEDREALRRLRKIKERNG
ncbi:hypothetical protein [Neobacillus mesonae]|uniref:hypothetical protein n=1 Tax=Neobacillus mesonae TaxID=1193713 RepID=UPI00203D5F29|nr:hypothetical protein [Neobacillus mesonae]MCM3568980.1 hypothetical protein [Neobacillus mesonae]